MGDRFATTDVPKMGGGLLRRCPLVELGPHPTQIHNVARAEPPRPTSIPSSILIHPAVWPQQTWAENWGLYPFWGGELGPHLTQCVLGRGLPLYQAAS